MIATLEKSVGMVTQCEHMAEVVIWLRVLTAQRYPCQLDPGRKQWPLKGIKQESLMKGHLWRCGQWRPQALGLGRQWWDGERPPQEEQGMQERSWAPPEAGHTGRECLSWPFFSPLICCPNPTECLRPLRAGSPVTQLHRAGAGKWWGH